MTKASFGLKIKTMNKFILTTSEASESVSAEDLQQENITSVILELDTTSFDGDSFQEIVTGNTDSTSNEQGQDEVSVWVIKVKDWILPNEQENLTYSDSGIEQEILSTGIMFENSCLQVGTYFLCLPPDIAISKSSVVLSYVRDALRKQGFRAAIINRNNTSDSMGLGN